MDICVLKLHRLRRSSRSTTTDSCGMSILVSSWPAPLTWELDYVVECTLSCPSSAHMPNLRRSWPDSVCRSVAQVYIVITVNSQDALIEYFELLDPPFSLVQVVWILLPLVVCSTSPMLTVWVHLKCNRYSWWLMVWNLWLRWRKSWRRESPSMTWSLPRSKVEIVFRFCICSYG